jgi:hypothetical protein
MQELKDKLLAKGWTEAEVGRFFGYLDSTRRAEAAKDTSKRPVSSNSADELYSLASKWHNLGLVIDGVNVVITGKNMAMPTFHGYKNKVLATYPEAEVDMGLVRQGDTFSLAKESGAVNYSHQIADPFGNQPIVGAYVIFKTKRGEYIENLGKDDYDKMRKASKQPYLWDMWESEFWLKSVIKRACKRHFYDVVEDIDKADNEQFGAVDLNQPNLTIENLRTKIKAASNLDDLLGIMSKLPHDTQLELTELAEVRAHEITDDSAAH